MTKIFFCYRREDSGHQAGRIFDHLSSHFGKEDLFKDVDSIPFGYDFRQVITDKVCQCDVVLALIGDNWLSASDKSGKRRLDGRAAAGLLNLIACGRLFHVGSRRKGKASVWCGRSG